MPASVTAVDNLHADLAALLVFLDDASEVSLRNVADDNLRKALLLAAASYFEHRMTQDVIGFVEEVVSKEHVVKWLVRKKAVERQSSAIEAFLEIGRERNRLVHQNFGTFTLEKTFEGDLRHLSIGGRVRGVGSAGTSRVLPSDAGCGDVGVEAGTVFAGGCPDPRQA